MKQLIVILIIGALCTGCAALCREPGGNVLGQADAKLAAEDYNGARALYSDFANANPKNSQAARARATQLALDRLLRAQTELENLKRELSDRQSEADRLEAEVTRLRADIERLRDIDLQERPRDESK